MSTVKLEHICKKYPNGFEAVKDFNLEIGDKEFIIFVGPSGCVWWQDWRISPAETCTSTERE